MTWRKRQWHQARCRNNRSHQAESLSSTYPAFIQIETSAVVSTALGVVASRGSGILTICVEDIEKKFKGVRRVNGVKMVAQTNTSMEMRSMPVRLGVPWTDRAVLLSANETRFVARISVVVAAPSRSPISAGRQALSVTVSVSNPSGSTTMPSMGSVGGNCSLYVRRRRRDQDVPASEHFRPQTTRRECPAKAQAERRKSTRTRSRTPSHIAPGRWLEAFHANGVRKPQQEKAKRRFRR